MKSWLNSCMIQCNVILQNATEHVNSEYAAFFQTIVNFTAICEIALSVCPTRVHAAELSPSPAPKITQVCLKIMRFQDKSTLIYKYFILLTFLADQAQVYDKVSCTAYTRHLRNIIPYLLQAESCISLELLTHTCQPQVSQHLLPLPGPILPSHLPQWFSDTYYQAVPSLQLLSFSLRVEVQTSFPASHLQTPAALQGFRLLSCFSTFLSTHLQRKGFLRAVTFLTHLFSWQWWWAPNSKCLLSSALLLHQSKHRRPMLLRVFQTATHKQHSEALWDSKQQECWCY